MSDRDDEHEKQAKTFLEKVDAALLEAVRGSPTEFFQQRSELVADLRELLAEEWRRGSAARARELREQMEKLSWR
jgi:hypothetical protein